MAHSHTRSARSRIRWPSLLAIPALLASIWLPTAVAQTVPKTASHYYVHDLPGAPASPRLDMWAGHVEIAPEHHGNLFFWLFKNRHIANRSRLVLWLNGGPGCSSMDGALMEIGPYRVQKDGNLKVQEGSWDEFANVLFVDQPVGTGFSYSDTNAYVHEMNEMASNMVTFLEKWFQIFPEYAHTDIYIAGESYAGQWIPYLADAMIKRNKQKMNDKWPLKGLLIGNGWISGPEQYISFVPFAYENNLITSGSEAEKVALEQQKTCIAELDKGAKDHVDSGICEGIMQEILKHTQNDQGCVNMYDVRLRDTYPSCGMNWPPDLEYVKPYLRRDDVLSALHVNKDKNTGWVECNNQVSSAFIAKQSVPSVKLLPSLLEQVPIVLFSGDKDLICNHIGTENLINNLEWNGAVGMELSPGVTAPRRDWEFEGEPAGQYQTARNLTYLRFYNSSHMVPFDYPRRTRDMLDRFMGVDIASIGGIPADSRIDGEKGVEVSVGGHPNSTAAEETEKTRLQAAKWEAYRRSGEVALFIVIVVAGIWGVVVWRGRRSRKGYKSVFAADPYDGGLGVNGSASKVERDVEAARDFDEAELDDLSKADQRHYRDVDRDRFGIGDYDSDEDVGPANGRANGHA
ncbi:Pheromone-processing carboxypeptidase kex1 [Pseudocercospora fuligena]|uniref:Carboxypeptidase n=1 Tax=Pseudocercospora fuligena TaxID=685502 RepID=A0A8H6RPQ5_9PEZI|nr:Pheromone-processing carboxypeptidase kex1 [Pseudocercospora fuligena]